MLVEQCTANLPRNAERLVLGSCQLTVGCTISRPSERRSSVASSLASRSGWRSGAITAAAARRSRVVTAATALRRTIELGHGVAGSWFPGSA